jgi:hypothetical protein
MDRSQPRKIGFRAPEPDVRQPPPPPPPPTVPTHRAALPLEDMQAEQTGAIVTEWTLVRVDRFGAMQVLTLEREVGPWKG